MLDQIASAAKPRLIELLKLKVRHIYETTPGTVNSKLVIEGHDVVFRMVKTTQSYKDIARFMAEDKLMGFVVTPGVLPVVKAISMDVRGRRMLVTRKIESRPDDRGVFAQIDDFGVRVMMDFDSVLNETILVWECLFAVA